MPKNVIVYKNKSGVIRKQAKEREHNYLKYWRIVRYWAKRKYEITDTEIEIFLYLYDIDLFTKGQFREFEGLLTWDKTRFNNLRDRGHIVEWRKKKNSRQARLYTLSVGTKRICSSIYKKLLQEEHIPENRHNNPVFSGDAYADRIYRAAIRRMNTAREAQAIKEREKKLGI